jgi:hypothetical protein
LASDANSDFAEKRSAAQTRQAEHHQIRRLGVFEHRLDRIVREQDLGARPLSNFVFSALSELEARRFDRRGRRFFRQDLHERKLA